MFLDKEDKITGDWELQAWGAELVKAREEGGCGLLVGEIWVHLCKKSYFKTVKNKYSRTSVAQTLMACFPRLFPTHS